MTTDHPTAEILYQLLREKLPTISIDTIYRTLITLANHGLINRVVTVESLNRFEATRTNSYGQWQELPEFSEPPLDLNGSADHWNYRKDDDDYYTQPGKLFRFMSPAQQAALFGNTARALGSAPEEVKLRHIENSMKADPAYGKGVTKALKVTLKTLKKS